MRPAATCTALMPVCLAIAGCGTPETEQGNLAANATEANATEGVANRGPDSTADATSREVRRAPPTAGPPQPTGAPPPAAPPQSPPPNGTEKPEPALEQEYINRNRQQDPRR